LLAQLGNSTVSTLNACLRATVAKLGRNGINVENSGKEPRVRASHGGTAQYTTLAARVYSAPSHWHGHC
jgi:hypothetical protein